jgi:hypothetical protein
MSTPEFHRIEARDFELLVQNLIYGLLTFEGHMPVTVHHRKRYPGKRSGHHHEIDLSYTTQSAGADVLVLVECKAYRRPVPVEDVLTLAERVDDIGANKGILVSLSGFDPGAIRIAKGRGIALAVATPHVRRMRYKVGLMPDHHDAQAMNRAIEAIALSLAIDPHSFGEACGRVWQQTMEYFSRFPDRIPQGEPPELFNFRPAENWNSESYGAERWSSFDEPWRAFDIVQFGALLVGIGLTCPRVPKSR